MKNVLTAITFALIAAATSSQFASAADSDRTPGQRLGLFTSAVVQAPVAAVWGGCTEVEKRLDQTDNILTVPLSFVAGTLKGSAQALAAPIDALYGEDTTAFGSVKINVTMEH